jgi:hypothetical protein
MQIQSGPKQKKPNKKKKKDSVSFGSGLVRLVPLSLGLCLKGKIVVT